MWTMFLAVLLSLAALGGTAQSGPLKPDGRMWEVWSKSGPGSEMIKAGYVQGAIEGFGAGATEGYYAGRMDEKNDALAYLKPCLKGACVGVPLASLIDTSGVPNGLDSGTDKIRRRFRPQNASVLDIVHQMDKFYADYKNTPVCLIVAAQESVASLNGKAPSEQELELERRGCNP